MTAINNILDCIKDMRGLPLDYDGFDNDISVSINSALMALNQIGIGKHGFQVVDGTETWEDFIGEDYPYFAGVKQFVYYSVLLGFDPPSNSFLVKNIEDRLQELTWRLNVQAETPSWKV